MAQIVDLSKPIREYPQDPFFMKVKIKHHSHARARWLVRLMGLPFRLFPRGFEGWSDDFIRNMGVHSATHIDAPWHYGSISEGNPAKTIDQVPLEWCYGEGVVLDFTHKRDMDVITREDMEEAVLKAGVKLGEGIIVLIRTGNDRLIGTAEYMSTGTGVSGAATRWLVEQGVRVMGIDQWGWDLPLRKTIRRIRKGADPEIFWEGHRAGISKEYCHIEQVVGLDQLPTVGFKVIAMPLPLAGCSASPIRLVAIID